MPPSSCYRTTPPNPQTHAIAPTSASSLPRCPLGARLGFGVERDVKVQVLADGCARPSNTHEGAQRSGTGIGELLLSRSSVAGSRMRWPGGGQCGMPLCRALLMQPVRTCGPQAWTGGTVVRGALEVVLAVQVKVGTEHVVHHDKTDLQGGGPSRRASARPWATGASCVQRCKARRPQQSAHARREGFFLGLGLGFRA